MTHRLSHGWAAAFVCTTLVLGACASRGVPPVDTLATARASIAQAEGASAAQTAPVELLAARQKMAKADEAMRKEQYGLAKSLAEEAQVDAELADRKARVAKAEATAGELARSNQQLSTEAQRNTTAP